MKALDSFSGTVREARTELRKREKMGKVVKFSRDQANNLQRLLGLPTLDEWLGSDEKDQDLQNNLGVKK